MSKLGNSLKPQVISTISKIASTTRPGCKPTTLQSSRSICYTTLQQIRSSRETLSHSVVEDQFVGLLIQAGACHKKTTPARKLNGGAQLRAIATSSQKRSAAVAVSVENSDYHAQPRRHTLASSVQLDEASKRRLRIRKADTRMNAYEKETFEVPLSRHKDPDELKKGYKNVRSQSKASPKAKKDVTFTQTHQSLVHTRHDVSSSRHGTRRPFVQQDENARSRLSPNSKLVENLPAIPRSKYQEMVDIYGLPIEEEAGGESHTPSLAAWGEGLGAPVDSIIQFPLAPRLTISARDEDRARQREKQLRDALTPRHIQVLDQLRKLLGQSPGTIKQDVIWQLYSQLPSPQVCYLSRNNVDRLFQHLAWIEYKHFQGVKEKVFQLLEQCNDEGIEVHRHHWTTAITLAGRWVRNIETDQVREAIETWMSMEQHGIRADPVVFNVLFDVAAKAGRFALADTIYSEMKARNMTMNRYFRCSMIHCAGLRKDGDAVRAAFNDFVAAGDIVDTAVMNLVVRSLIRAGEGEAAEHVFSNMKTLHADKFPGASTWQERRALAKSLKQTVAHLHKKQKKHEASFFGSHYSNKDELDKLQRLTPIHPDESTYRIIIGYHALVSGDIGRIQELLSEMRAEGFHVHGSVFVNIFWGFVRHGGYSFSAWTPDLLEQFWREFVAAVPYEGVTKQRSILPADDTSLMLDDPDRDISIMSEDHRPVHFSITVVKNIMHAFYHCCGKARMLRAWTDIQKRWSNMSTEEEAILHAYCKKRLKEHIWLDD